MCFSLLLFCLLGTIFCMKIGNFVAILKCLRHFWLSLVLTCEISTGISKRECKYVHISDIRVRSVSHVRDILVYD